APALLGLRGGRLAVLVRDGLPLGNHTTLDLFGAPVATRRGLVFVGAAVEDTSVFRSGVFALVRGRVISLALDGDTTLTGEIIHDPSIISGRHGLALEASLDEGTVVLVPQHGH